MNYKALERHAMRCKLDRNCPLCFDYLLALVDQERSKRRHLVICNLTCGIVILAALSMADLLLR